MTKTQGTGTATEQTPKPESTSTTQPAAANPAPAAEPQTVTPQPAQPAQPAVTEPKPTTKTEEKPKIQTENRRTKKQFDKLTDSNKRLFDANENLRNQLTKRAQSDEQFAPIQQPPVQQQPVQEVKVEDFVEIDPVSGERFINDKKLKTKIDEVNSKATKAEEAVKRYINTSEQREIDRQNEEAFESFPELNPSGEEFNVKFHNQTRALIYDSLINPQDYGGRPLSFKKAAEFAKGGDTVTDDEKNQQASASKDKPEGQTVAADEPTKGADAKQQAAASVAGEQPESREQLAGSEELTRLQQATRRGDTEALARRIANTDHVFKKEDESGEKAS